jgi:ABC-type nitrate/sulfonate/bicarbonate transport system permease component
MAVSRDKIPGPVSDGRSYSLLILLAACLIWYVAGNRTTNHMVLPTFQSVVFAFFEALTSKEILLNLAITMRRVLLGFSYAFCIGVPIGLLMGYSNAANKALAPFINSARQVPVMAWVPLAIIWFGLGDGPTVFLIAFTGVFTMIINTINAVQDIDRNYYYAARSLGATRWQVIRDVVLPGSFPGIFTGGRLAIGLGWMSVI